MDQELLQIDGSTLEGGGQIIRIALTLSALKRIPIKINHIRSGRSKPGLMEQHLKGVELIRDLTNAKLKGGHLGSTEILFYPQKISGGSFKSYVKTAGSISLLLQVALPCTLFANARTELELYGGTNCEMAPQVDYTTEVFRPNLEKFGATFDFDLIKRGYFPRGGGNVKVSMEPARSLKSVTLLDQGEIKAVYGWSFVAGTLPIKLAHDMANAAEKTLKGISKSLKVERYKEDNNIASDNASGIILVVETTTGCILGSSALGKRGENLDQTGQRAASGLLKAIKEGACVDEHCQDQIIVFMALANGISRVRVGEITLHTKTAMFVAEQFSNFTKFTITPDGSSHIIECNGIGET